MTKTMGNIKNMDFIQLVWARCEHITTWRTIAVGQATLVAGHRMLMRAHFKVIWLSLLLQL